MRLKASFIVVAQIAALAVLACGRSNDVTLKFSRPKAQPGGKAVASFGGDAITQEELKARLAEMSPYARARYQTLEQKKEYVDGIVRFELLASEAARRNLQNDPEVVEAAKKVMVQVLLKQELEAKAVPVSDAEIQKYYDAHRTDYVKPAMTRLAHVFFATEHEAAAQAALKEAQALAPLDYAAFSKLAREKSEDPRTRSLDGDMRFLSDDELSAQYGPEVTEAAKELTQVGSVLPRLVKTQSGYHVLKLQGRQVALNLGVDQVKPQIQQQLSTEAKMERYRVLLDQLKEKSHYTIDDGTLASTEIDVKAPAVESKGPTPGFLPPPEPPRPTK